MATYSADSQETAITTATTTTILSAPGAATTEKRVKAGMLSIRNKGTADNTITIIVDVSATDYEVAEFTLGAEEKWTNEVDEFILRGTGKSLEITTSSTSAIDVVCGFIQKVA